MSFIFQACLLLLASLLLPEWLLLLGAYLGWRAAADGIYTLLTASILVLTVMMAFLTSLT